MSKHRSVSEEIRSEQKEALKGMSFKKKLSYFWDYYKIHTFVFIVAVVMIIGGIRNIIHSKDYIFYAFMLNSFTLDSTALSEDFAAFAGLDTEQYTCYINTDTALELDVLSEYDVATAQMIMALVQACDLDVMVTGAEVFSNYAEGEMFMDLRTLYTEEELAPYQDNLYYIDLAAIAAAKENPPSDSMDETQLSAKEQAAVAESHRYPETMTTPVPVGVFVTDSAFIQSNNCYLPGPVIFGIITTSHQPENAKAYLEYLWTTTGPSMEITE